MEDETALSKKEQDRRRLAEARRRNAEKYGDTYVEVTDDDLKSELDNLVGEDRQVKAQKVHIQGWAIILFTIVTKLLLLPLAIKQQKSTVKMQIIQPKMQEIQAKYKNNPQKMNEEIQALYERENYSMTAAPGPAPGGPPARRRGGG